MIAALGLAACAAGGGVDRATWTTIACEAFRALDTAASGRIGAQPIEVGNAGERSMIGARWVDGEDIRRALTETSRDAVATI